MKPTKNKAQQIIESLLLFAVVIAVVAAFVGPSGPFRPAVRSVVNRVIDEIYYEYYWFTGPWSACSVPCGGGVRSRTVYCADADNNPVADSYCANNPEVGPRPVDTEVCNDFPCSRNGGWCPWSDWSECSLPCGGGTQYHTRVCECPPPAEGGRTCDGADIEYQDCNTDPCCALRWVRRPISPCPPCGMPWAQGTYQVVCQEECLGSPPTVRPDADCIAAGAGAKPAEIVNCGVGYCYLWYTSDWGPCSPCGPNGTHSRTVYCYYYNNWTVPVADSLCINEDPRNIRPEPQSVESCFLRDCQCGLLGANAQWCAGATTPLIPEALDGTVNYINSTQACSAAVSDCEAQCLPGYVSTGTGCFCTPGPPLPYRDSVDNDCDGQVDEIDGADCSAWQHHTLCQPEITGCEQTANCEDPSGCASNCEERVMRDRVEPACCLHNYEGNHQPCYYCPGDVPGGSSGDFNAAACSFLYG